MSSGDDDYGNPQRAIEHERTLNRMKAEEISRLTQALADAEARSEKAERERHAGCFCTHCNPQPTTNPTETRT